MSIHISESTVIDEVLTQIGGHVVTPRPDCMIWTSDADRGYGKVQVNGVTKRVHRVVWELTHGPIPDGLTIDHLCRVRSCVNTAHMELVTMAENVRRGVKYRTRTAPRTHCAKGHEFTDENTGIDSGGKRRCLTCRRASEDRYNAIRRARRAAA